MGLTCIALAEPALAQDLGRARAPPQLLKTVILPLVLTKFSFVPQKRD